MSPTKSPLAQLRHDLRTPINHILGYGELLEEDLAERGVEKLDDLERIQAAGRQLLALIETRLTESSLAGVTFQEETETTGVETVGQAPAKPPVVLEPVLSQTGRILVVDDHPDNRDVLARRLERQGHTTAQAENGVRALALMAEQPFDVVLLDVMMPEMDGFTVLARMKNDPALRHIPVIMISALDEIEGVVRCIENGAEDFLPKPFNPTLLRARIGASLEKKRFRDQEQAYLRQIEETQRRLEQELQEAAKYVEASLPAPMDSPFVITWAYAPSTELGGDSFGYHWIDDDHFAIYLLDVCGHGVGAALLSVAAINVLRSGSLPDADFHDPASVLAALNAAFQMENHNNMYFTIWYGVYERSSRTLRHASGGHPPALLLTAGSNDDTLEQVVCGGMLIGALPGVSFQSASLVVPPGARLFVFCDGAYEIKRPEGGMLDFNGEFLPFLLANGRSADLPCKVLEWIRSIHQGSVLDDDYSFLAIEFP